MGYSTVLSINISLFYFFCRKLLLWQKFCQRELFYSYNSKKGQSMNTGNNPKGEWTKEDESRWQQAMFMLQLKWRLDALERQRNNNEELLIKMWNTTIGWIIPRYTDYPRK
jgi:hypothetical protein